MNPGIIYDTVKQREQFIWDFYRGNTEILSMMKCGCVVSEIFNVDKTFAVFESRVCSCMEEMAPSAKFYVIQHRQTVGL